MKLPYSWLVELTGSKWPAEEMGDRLTLCGTACEDIEPTARYFDKVVVGKVLDIKPVSGADKIRQATVDIGKEMLDLVCGAPNLKVGQKVPVAKLGAKLTGGLEIKKTRIRGIESSGMICSESELGISLDHAGILVLDDKCRVGMSLAKALDYDDYIMTFELTPNRGDSMSAFGVAREIAALSSSKIIRPKFKINPSNDKASKYIKVEIEDTAACPRYAARIIKDITIAESPWWLKKKLLMCGIRPINNVVDISNFVMLECGHPLHAFDLNRFGSNKVVVRRAQKNEIFKTLDEKEHKLSPEVLLITNGKEAVAAAGVMGGLDSEVSEATTDILLEAAYFNLSVIRRSRKFLNMTSESQARFEKGVDPNGIEYAIDRAAYLLQELCFGIVLSGIVDCYPKKITPCKIAFRPQRCNNLLGTSYK
ncbi:MAG: phenylalanine--tRNA ligase subunit beta, partial [candidate division Zixibacteria bacterium]